MKLREQIICAADAYCKSSGLSRARLSTIILGGGHRLDKIAQDGDLNTASFERAMRWLSENWPDSAEWPEGVERPCIAPLPISSVSEAAQ